MIAPWTIEIDGQRWRVGTFLSPRSGRTHAKDHFLNPEERWDELGPGTPTAVWQERLEGDRSEATRDLLVADYVGVVQRESADRLLRACQGATKSHWTLSVATHGGVFVSFNAKLDVDGVSGLLTAFRPAPDGQDEPPNTSQMRVEAVVRVERDRRKAWERRKKEGRAMRTEDSLPAVDAMTQLLSLEDLASNKGDAQTFARVAGLGERLQSACLGRTASPTLVQYLAWRRAWAGETDLDGLRAWSRRLLETLDEQTESSERAEAVLDTLDRVAGALRAIELRGQPDAAAAAQARAAVGQAVVQRAAALRPLADFAEQFLAEHVEPAGPYWTPLAAMGRGALAAAEPVGFSVAQRRRLADELASQVAMPARAPGLGRRFAEWWGALVDALQMGALAVADSAPDCDPIAEAEPVPLGGCAVRVADGWVSVTAPRGVDPVVQIFNEHGDLRPLTHLGPRIRVAHLPAGLWLVQVGPDRLGVKVQ